jgi:subtilisin family serine protease
MVDVRFGKAAWLKLEEVPLNSHVEGGMRVFEPANARAGRAAVIVNTLMATTFEKAVRSFAPVAEVRAAARERVDAAAFRDPAGKLRIVYREAVVRFEPGTPADRRKKLLAKYGLEVRKRSAFQKDQVIVADTRRRYIGNRMVELANQLAETDEVAFAFPNFVSEYTRQRAPTPIAAQWHLSRIRAEQAWAKTSGKGVVVAVIDDGVDVDHPDLKSNILRNPDPDDALDLYGRDFVVDDDNPGHYDPRPKRFRAPFDETTYNDIHGTPCAGVVAASGNLRGVRGIAPEAKILPVKIFHAEAFAEDARVADSIRYASRFADILSCSWSCGPSPDIEFAVKDAGKGRGGKGSAVFFATGNEYKSSIGYPARLDDAIAVGACGDDDVRAPYSNYGAGISIVAPSNGGRLGIFTSDVSELGRGYNPGSASAGGVDGMHTNDFGGTSSATPLAAGVGALALAAKPSLTREELKALLQDTADKIGSGYNSTGKSAEYGYGRVNAERVVAKALGLPDPGPARTARKPAKKKKKAPKKKSAKARKKR